MKIKISLLTLAALLTLSPLLRAQDSDSEVYTQRLFYVDVHPGKGSEWRDLVRETSMKIAQARADSGEILSWTLLRSVYPGGQEARSDYLISVISAGLPREYEHSMAESLEMVGADMSDYELFDRRRDLSTLVGSELWQPHIYNGGAKVGNYISLNLMRVHDWDLIEETTQTWSPLSQEMIKRGSLTAWVFASKRFPSGTDVAYRAYSANIYPTMEDAFKGFNMAEIFEKVHPNLDRSEYVAKLPKARDIANREFWHIVERVSESD